MPLLPPLRDPFFIYRHRQLIHTFRAVLALAIIFGLLALFQLPHGSWALVSALMVMGGLPHVGGVLDKGLQRLAGTILGGLLGIALLLLPLPSAIFANGLTLAAIGVATYATFTSRYGYSALMFGITLLMVVGDGDPEISTALWRAANVVIGTSIAILVTLLVLPQKATDVLRFLLADNLDKLARLYHSHTASKRLDLELGAKLMKTATAQLVKQRGLIDGVHQEGRIKRGALNDILSLERRMMSTVELLLETHWDTRDGHDLIEGLEGLREEQHRLARALGTLAFQIRTGQLIDVKVAPFSLQRYAGRALGASTENGRQLFSPSGYLWLNRELARQTSALAANLGNIQRLPSQRLQRRANHDYMIHDKQRIPHETSGV
ncbi:FUSC family protein [Halotalea alkalilenta]|uniref:FUSC family protein n=1 Tax=Halotalea alkalilenta TaxID=376489 RepID=UPI000483FD2D|nr:FUSC family protein [Halotalea alkalilenta]